MKLNLFLPFPKSQITQLFGQNANGSYASQGLGGHPAIDFAATWDTPLFNCLESSYIYSTLNRNNPDLMKYRAVCSVWDDPDSNTSYELIYGHCSDIGCQVGTFPQIGAQLASVGNTGDVFTNGIEVSAIDKQYGSKAGAHLHFQLRLMQRVKTISSNKQYLFDGNGLLKRNSCYYEVVDFSNGFNGCIDPMPFFNNVLASDGQKAITDARTLLSKLQAMVVALRQKLINK